MSKVAIWLDSSRATIVTFKNGVPQIETIDSGVESHVRIDGEGKESSQFGAGNFTNNEHRENQRHSNEVQAYLKKLTQKIESYEQILLFGPTNTKNQLKNILDEQKAFAGKKIEVKNSDKMTENQLVAFAREHLTQN